MSMSINTIGQFSATDGRTVSEKNPRTKDSTTKNIQTVSTTDVKKPENAEEIKVAVQQLQEISNMIGRNIRFNVNEDLERVVIKVIDPSTDKVIKEIPSEEIQKLKIHMKETFGFLVDEMR